MNGARGRRGSLLALVLILAGALLFLDNLDILPIGNLRAYWPVWMVILGIFIFDRRRSVVATVWAVALAACGILLILGNLGILHVTGDIIWPILLIALGAILLLRPPHVSDWRSRLRNAALERRRRRWGAAERPGRNTPFSGNAINEAVVFGSLNRRVDTPQFEGGKLDAVFGSIELDLSGAAISNAERRAEIELNAVFGGIEVTVPPTWKVVMTATAVFGGCDNSTLPPRPEPGFEPVTLVVSGEAVFGGITIQN